jgi:hypothetical protein
MKAHFVGKFNFDLLDEPVDGTKWFRSTLPFTFCRPNGVCIHVPANVDTDFATIWKCFRWLLSRVGKHSKAAVLHDYLCTSKIVSRKLADRIFNEAMEPLKVNWIKRRLFYFGVRTYSILTFKK